MPLTQQQLLAVETVDSHVLVSAGAGSGKTHVLVERYIEILKRNPEFTVANLIAVTYTRKAASEMRVRLKARFKELLFASSDEQRERWAACLADIDAAKIGTIHSLCESLLKTFAIEAAIDSEYEVLDDLEQVELLQKSIDQAFREIIARQLPEHALLLNHQLKDLRKWLTQMIKSSLQLRESIIHVASLNTEQLVEYARNILMRLCNRFLPSLLEQNLSAIEYLRSNPHKDPKNELESQRERAISFSEQLEALLPLSEHSQLDQVASCLAELKIAKKGNFGGNSDDAKAIREQIRHVRENVRAYLKVYPPSLISEDAEAFESIRQIISLFERAISIYEREKAAALRLDFDDLIVRAQKTFSSQSPSGVKFRDTIAAVLVDEFQDTNRSQSDLIRALIGEKTKLFLIGDDKQSIYKFQGADVSTFNEWKDSFASNKSAEGWLKGSTAIMPLNRSFRSDPKLVAFVNAVFAELLHEGHAYSAKYEALEAARSKIDEGERIELVLFDGAIGDIEAKAEERMQKEAESVAQWISSKMAERVPVIVRDASGKEMTRKIEYGDFAVLVQQNSHFDEIQSALADARIPYVMLGGKTFLNRQEIFDIENILRFLDNPADSHALLGALRSPMFSVTDEIIHLVCSKCSAPEASLWEKLQQAVSLDNSGFESIRKSARLLSNFLKDAQRVTVSELVRQIITRTNYDLILMGLPNGRQRSRNLWKLVSLAAKHEELSCGEFAQRLALMRELELKQADAPLDTGNAVKLMTIHGSKGLEFPAVALPALGTKLTGSGYRSKLIFHREYGIALNTAIAYKDEKPSWYKAALALDKEMEVEEKKRLLYVAMTRARDYLGIFVDQTSDETDSFRNWLIDVLGRDILTAETYGKQRNFSAKGRNATYSIVSADAMSKSFKQAPASTALLLDTAKKSSDLLKAIPPLPVSEPSNYTGWTRITPSAKGVFLDATILGTYFHALMEDLSADLRRPSEALMLNSISRLGNVAVHPEFRAALLAEGNRLLDQFFGSKLVTLLKSAKQRHLELPYSILLQDRSETRRPDLLFEDEQGQWWLVDFKTDQVDVKDLSAQANKYKKQLATYARELETLLGLQFKSAIYFARLGILHELLLS
jgi:ATP-dependent helicase/nuclease subunit A